MSHSPQRRKALIAWQQTLPQRSFAPRDASSYAPTPALRGSDTQPQQEEPHETSFEIRRQLEPLHEMVFASFPPVTYYGTVVAGGDDGPWPGDETDDEDLFRMLKQRRWTDIPADFINRHLGAFVLLTAQAFATFIPAWLIFSLEHNFKGAEFVVFTFGPQDLDAPTHIRPLSVEMFRVLTPLQRRTLHLFLQATAAHLATSPLGNHALVASDTVDSLISVFEANRI